MPESKSSPILARVYEELDLVGEDLVEVTEDLAMDSGSPRWHDLGDWLLLAARVNADRVFFLNDDPVLVFSSLPRESNENDILECYRRTWSLARPRCLFLAVGDELRVYSLASPPTAPGIDSRPLTPLEIVTKAADLGDRLARFHRSRLESGAAFEDGVMAETTGRADHQLLKDMRTATVALEDADLSPRIAQTLIERSILVRYLEDRSILTDEYFDEFESNHLYGVRSSTVEFSLPDFGPPSRFIPMLGNRDLVFDLFNQLAKEFNHELFGSHVNERDIVTQSQLRLLMDLLQGKANVLQEPLFLWAYDFSVIPTSLISTMYELFHRKKKGKASSNTYYTPPELVEFVLAGVLDHAMLDSNPRVCDPACGSGIFLVESFRRIVRHEMLRHGQSLSSERLRMLLEQRIAGCDVDEAAVRLAAFSLYIAFLNYQSPRKIRQAGPFSPLINTSEAESSTAPLVVGDAFSPLQGEREEYDVDLSYSSKELPWRLRAFDVVVGNPPWTEIRGQKNSGEQWALARNRPYGDRNPSQLFLWRSLDLLADDGLGALLIGAKAMLNTRSTSREFRMKWIPEVSIEYVVNFSHVRRDFFRTAVAPFMLLRYQRLDGASTGMVVYETATPVIHGRRGSAALARLSRQVVPQESLQSRDYLWKTYSAGSFRDEALVARMEIEDRLCDWMPGKSHAFGFQRASDLQKGAPPSLTLRQLRILGKFDSWGPLREEWFEPVPPLVNRVPEERFLDGQRLLIRWGVSSGFGPHARLETDPLGFRHTTFAISLQHLPPWQAKVVLGTLLSSLGRYWLYMISGSWGTWKDQIRSHDLLNLPIRLPPKPNPTTRRIVRSVDSLRRMIPARARKIAVTELPSEMEQIDYGIADLFELTEAERHLVADFWASQRPNASAPVSIDFQVEGTEADVDLASREGIYPYLKVFLRIWNRRLDRKGEFHWRIWHESTMGVIAVIFETQGTDSAANKAEDDWHGESWSAALRRLGVQWASAHGRSILSYGMVRAVTDTAIVVVKRNEKHLWTATAAWQDADATAAQLMTVCES